MILSETLSVRVMLYCGKHATKECPRGGGAVVSYGDFETEEEAREQCDAVYAMVEAEEVPWWPIDGNPDHRQRRNDCRYWHLFVDMIRLEREDVAA